MGMLGAAFLQGAGQGLQTLSHGLMRGVERDEEQKMWEKRAALLEQLRRDSAKNMRADELDDRERNADRTRALATGDIEAAGNARRGVAVADAQSPELIQAEKDKQARELQYRIDAAKAVLNDPGIAEAEKAKAARQLEDDKKRMEALMPVEAKRAGMISAATVGAAESERAKHAPADSFAKLDPKVQAQYKTAADQYKQLQAARLKAIENQTWNPKTDEYQRGIEVQIRILGDRMTALLGDGPNKEDAAIREALLAGGEPDKKDDVSPGGKKDKVSSPPFRITPSVAPTKTDEERVAEIVKALEVDDKIKSSAGGILGRAIQNRAVPLGMAERQRLEKELARLRGGR